MQTDILCRVSGGNQSGTQLKVTGIAENIKAGDCLRIEGLTKYQCPCPCCHQNHNEEDFYIVVTADAQETADHITFFPPMIPFTQRREHATVLQSPADNAAIRRVNLS